MLWIAQLEWLLAGTRGFEIQPLIRARDASMWEEEARYASRWPVRPTIFSVEDSCRRHPLPPGESDCSLERSGASKRILGLCSCYCCLGFSYFIGVGPRIAFTGRDRHVVLLVDSSRY